MGKVAALPCASSPLLCHGRSARTEAWCVEERTVPWLTSACSTVAKFSFRPWDLLSHWRLSLNFWHLGISCSRLSIERKWDRFVFSLCGAIEWILWGFWWSLTGHRMAVAISLGFFGFFFGQTAPEKVEIKLTFTRVDGNTKWKIHDQVLSVQNVNFCSHAVPTQTQPTANAS